MLFHAHAAEQQLPPPAALETPCNRNLDEGEPEGLAVAAVPHHVHVCLAQDEGDVCDGVPVALCVMIQVSLRPNTEAEKRKGAGCAWPLQPGRQVSVPTSCSPQAQEGATQGGATPLCVQSGIDGAADAVVLSGSSRICHQHWLATHHKVGIVHERGGVEAKDERRRLEGVLLKTQRSVQFLVEVAFQASECAQYVTDRCIQTAHELAHKGGRLLQTPCPKLTHHVRSACAWVATMPTGSLWAYREEGGPHALRLQLLQGKGQCPYKGWSPVPCITHRTRSGRPRSCGA